MSIRPKSTEEAVDLFLDRMRAGETIDPAAFAAEHPEFEPDLSSALDALMAFKRAVRMPAAGHPSVLDRPDETGKTERIGNFRVVREIGHGGMGVVFEAIEERLNRRVALKVLPPEMLSSPSARTRFRREAELAARLDHSGIATVYGAGMEDERPWIAMRYVEGSTLASLISDSRDRRSSCVELTSSQANRRDAAVGTAHIGHREASASSSHTGRREATVASPPASGREATLAVASLIAKVARALRSAHEQGVVHRDIKPSNVIVQPDGSPVLLDFGLAIAEEPDGGSLTRTGEAPGTPAYLAPETISGEVARPDSQSDVYALGVTLYECLTLRRPFDAPTRVALFRAILSASPVDSRALNHAVSRDLAVVVSTAMERERARRYRSALALAEDLEACVAGRTIAARPVPLHGRMLRWARREPKQALLAASLGATAIALALFGGNYWASRDVVHAAEKVARDQSRERALVEGYLAVERGDYPSSENAFSSVLELEPGNLEAQAGRILARIGKQRLKEALALLESTPNSPGFDALRAYCRGVPVDQDAGALNAPDLGSLDLMLIGSALSAEGVNSALSRHPAIFARALAMMNEAVVRAPTARGFLHVQRSITAYEARDAQASRSAASALLALWPDSYDEVFAAGSALTDLDPEASIPIVQRAAKLRPMEPAPLQVLGDLYADLGDFAAAERSLWLALELSQDPEVYNSLGRSLALRGCLDEAIEAFRSGTLGDRFHERSWQNLGEAELESGDADSCAFAEELVLGLDPTNGEAHALLGAALERLGRLDDARAHLEYAIALSPDQPGGYVELAELLTTMREQGAKDVVSAGLERMPDDKSLLDLRDKLRADK